MSLSTDKMIRVPITQDDIDRTSSGEPDDWSEDHCPIEWALLRMFPRAVGASVDTKYFTVFFIAEPQDVEIRGYLGEDAAAFVNEHDAPRDVEPQTVELYITKVERRPEEGIWTQTRT